MTWVRLVRSELRKISTTRMPWIFVGILIVISATNAFAILAGTDADGSKGFISTAADQQSLLAFAANAMMGAGLFGAMAAARDYDHHTIVPTFLGTPRRHRAMLAQFTAVFLAGGLLGLLGEALTLLAAIITLPLVDFSFLLSAGAVLGAGTGAVVRNSAGAVTAAVLMLIIAPPLVVQFLNNADWVPSTIANVISGVGEGPGLLPAFAILAAWALIPAAIAIGVVERRDVI